MLLGQKQSAILQRPKCKEFSDVHIDLPITYGVYLSMTVEGRKVMTNVPHLVVHHSPDGFSFGYGGSGPADLALNILQWFLERREWSGPVTPCYDGACFQRVWELHQEFKWKFIAPIIAGHATLSYQAITEWLDSKL